MGQGEARGDLFDAECFGFRIELGYDIITSTK